MADNLLFRKGTYAELQSASFIAGSINFTTDEPAIYLDLVDSEGKQERKRIGDIIQFETMSQFEKYYNDHSNNLPTSALYYITETNALLKWDKKTNSWIQINSPSGEGDITIGELESRVNSLSTSVAGLNERVTDLDSLTIIEGKGKKGRVTELEEDVAELQSKKADANTVASTYATITALTEGLEGKADASSLNSLSSTVGELQGRVTTIGTDYVTKAEKASMDKATSDANGVAVAAQSAAKAAQDDVDALEVTVNSLSTTLSSNYYVKSEIDTKVSDLNTSINNLTNGAVKNNTDNIANEISRATGVEEQLQTSINNLSTTTSSNIEAAKTAVKAELVGETGDSDTANTFYGVRAYIDKAMTAADAMTFKGVLGGESEVVLPLAAETKAGDTYKIGTKMAMDSLNATISTNSTDSYLYVGDLLIAKEDGSNEYYHITSGYEDDYNVRLGNNKEDNKVILKNATGGNLGSLKFESNNANLTAVLSGEEGSDFVANSTVTLSLTWGSF